MEGYDLLLTGSFPVFSLPMKVPSRYMTKNPTLPPPPPTSAELSLVTSTFGI
jgi:hypothetical protein